MHRARKIQTILIQITRQFLVCKRRRLGIRLITSYFMAPLAALAHI